MREPVPILICDTAGPVGHELLRRRELASYWALQRDEALSVLAEAKPVAALVRARFAEALLPARGATKVIVLAEEGSVEAARAQWMGLGAAAVVSEKGGAEILEAVSSHSGLAFAKAPRVSYKTAVEITIGGKRSTLEALNLSASGIAVRGLQGVSVADRVEVYLPQLEPPVRASASVVRCADDAGTPMAGLRFLDLPAESHAQLARLVAEALKVHAEAMAPIDLGEAAPEPLVEEDRRPSEEALAELRTMLREVHQEAQRDSKLAAPRRDSATRLAARLSPPEQASVRGAQAPSWAETAVETRLRLHQDRREHGRAQPATVREALVLCRSMSRDAGEPRSLTEICGTRAALLREVYADPLRARHGSS